MISVITTLKDRKRLLNFGLWGIYAQRHCCGPMDLNVADGGSVDGLDNILADWSYKFETVTKYTIDRNKSFYKVIRIKHQDQDYDGDEYSFVLFDIFHKSLYTLAIKPISIYRYAELINIVFAGLE